MRLASRRRSLTGMTSELLIANVDQGGGPMMGVLLAVALVGGLVYLVRSRRRSDGDDASGRSGDE
jgi:hypothetical protein